MLKKNTHTHIHTHTQFDAGFFGGVLYAHGHAKNITRACLGYNDSTRPCAIRESFLPFGLVCHMAMSLFDTIVSLCYRILVNFLMF